MALRHRTTKRREAAAKLPELFQVVSWGLTGGLFMLLVLAGCNKPSQTETPAPANVRSSADVVKATVVPANIAVGSTGEATVTLSIASGYHVNANPATYNYLIATEVTPGRAEEITVGQPVYPAAVKQKFQFADDPLAVYEGQTQIKLPLTAAANAARGAHSLPLNIRVQACDQEKCFPPDTVRTTASVEIK